MTSGVATPAPSPLDGISGRSYIPVATQIVIVTVLIYALFWNVLAYMASDWWNYDAYSQGMALPPLALYVAWLRRQHLLSVPGTHDWNGVILTGCACLMYLLGKLASEFFLMRISFVVLISSLIWTFWGLQRLKTLALPILLLATMVPLPIMVYNSLAAPLQLFASDISARLAQWWGVSIYRDGNILQLANVTLGVAEACSGLNSLSALVVGSVLVGYLMCTTTLARVLVFLSAVPIAIGVNILRVTGTALLADNHEEYAIGFYHTFSGWLVFLVGIGMLYGCAYLLHVTAEKHRTA